MKEPKSELLNKTRRGSLVLAINIMAFGLFFLRDIYASRFFGLSGRMDSVYLGIMVPTLAVNFLFQPLSDLLIPKYQARLVYNTNIYHLYINVLFYVCLVSFFTSLGFYFSKELISDLMANGFSIENRNLVASFIAHSIPIIFLGGMIISTNILLNSIGQYIFTAIASLCVPVSSILFIKLLGGRYGEISFILGMIIGQIINFLMVIIFLFAKSKNKFEYRDFKLIKISRAQMLQYGSQNLVNLCFYGFNTISASFGTHFKEGTTSLIVLVNKLISFFTNLFNNTFSSVLMPYFSRVFLGDKSRFHKENRTILYLITFFGLIGILATYFCSTLISSILFSSSKITPLQASEFIKYLRIGIFQAPFLITMIICFKWLTIYSEFKILSIFSSIALALDFALNILTKNFLGSISILISPYLTLLAIILTALFVMQKKDIGIRTKDIYVLSSLWTLMTLLLIGLIF